MPLDHRNKPVSLLRSSWVMFWRSIGRGERVQRWKRIDRSFTRFAPTRNYWIFGSLMGGYLAGWLAVVFLYYATGIRLDSAMIFVMVGTGSAGHLAACVLFPIRHKAGKTFAACCLAESICPVCEYGLAGLEVEADGCVQCAECGSHWRTPRGQHTDPL